MKSELIPPAMRAVALNAGVASRLYPDKFADMIGDRQR
jgi:hypothetical protein